MHKQSTYIVQVGEMAEQIKNAFKQRIAEKDWLDDATKKRTKEKVLAIGMKLIIELTEVHIAISVSIMYIP